MLLALSAAALADFQYRVKPMPEQNMLEVQITIPVTKPITELQMPNWAPGSYVLVDNFNNVKDLKATGDGVAIEAAKPSNNTWSFDTSRAKTLTVTYSLPSTFSNGAMHYSGPSSYLYVVDRKAEPCKLILDVPKDWRVAIGLDEDRGLSRSTRMSAFTAPTYDVLADNPVTMGDFVMDSYTVRGKPHYIVCRGPFRKDVDMNYLLKACRHITEVQGDFFGGLPYNKYVWHFMVTDNYDGAGGLEHLSSTQITLASGLGPRAISVLSHEFFHLWNVKRIRSAPLGPFDYTQLPKTGALWWLEGTTDYYAHLLLFRSGWWGEDTWFADIIGNYNSVKNNAARLTVSPYDASYRVGEAANGRGNSNGYQISYYDLGFLAGVCLDTEIRYRTDGKRSLDDVIRALYDLTKDNKPGFAEDEIRKQCVRFGGPTLGEFYDQVIMKPGEMPVEAQLAKMGLKMSQQQVSFVDTGIRWTPSKTSKGARVQGVSGPAEAAGLMRDDLILSINGRSTVFDKNKDITVAMQTELDRARTDVSVLLHVMRGDKEMDISITPVPGTRQAMKIEADPSADAKTRKLREGWYYAGRVVR